MPLHESGETGSHGLFEAGPHFEFGAQVLDALREAVAVTDRDGGILWANAAFAALAGVPRTALAGRPLETFCAAPQARRIEQHQEIRDALARRGAWQGRIDLRRADGSVAATEAGVTMLPSEQGDLWIHVRRDITERLALEEAAVAASRAQQQRLGLELHDRLGQDLAGTSMLVRTLRNAIVAGSAPDAALLGDVENLLQTAVARCRDLAQAVSPFVIDDAGLGAAIEDLAARTRRDTGLAIHAGVCPRSARLEGNFAYHLYCLVQLALAGALGHDGVSRIDLQIWHEEDERVALAIVGDGRGEPRAGADARLLAHRLALLGGSSEPLEASRGRHGLIAMLPLPLPPQAATPPATAAIARRRA